MRIKIWGDYACFSRPETCPERVSYEVPTPSALVGLLRAIYGKPAIRWVIDRITVLNPIRLEAIKRNEIKPKAKGKSKPIDINADGIRTQILSLVLRDVAYVVDAHLVLSGKRLADGKIDDNLQKHVEIATRRIKNGQYVYQPYLGCREFAADFCLLENDEQLKSEYKDTIMDFGYMLHGLQYLDDPNDPSREEITGRTFFHARMINGIIDVTDPIQTL